MARPKDSPPPGSNPEHPLTVSGLSDWIKRSLEASIPSLWLEAEISDLVRAASGHLYMTLKDAKSQIKGVMWRSSAMRVPFQLEEGQSLLCYGGLDVYPPRGSYQFILQSVQPLGLGALQLAFQQLHRKLEREGLFAPEKKRSLPRFPSRIGFVTSPSGAAVHDFLQVLRRRWQGVQVLIVPSRVQGDGAAVELAKAIQTAARIRPQLDVLVVGRGGGSLEDLWAFNEEPLVRAVAASPIPTISAVGHEIDVTLCDLAADVRALTPTEAAERAVPEAALFLQSLEQHRSRIHHWMIQSIHQMNRRLQLLEARPVLLRPKEFLQRRAQRLDELQLRMTSSSGRSLERIRQRWERALATMDALQPLRVLQRGYSITRHARSNEVLSTVDGLQVGDSILTLVQDGQVQSVVQKIDKGPADLPRPENETRA